MSAASHTLASGFTMVLSDAKSDLFDTIRSFQTLALNCTRNKRLTSAMVIQLAWFKSTKAVSCKQLDVWISGFVLEELDSVQYIMTSSFVLNQILLLRPFYHVLVSWEQISFSFGSTYHLLFPVIMYCSLNRQRTIQKRRVNKFGLFVNNVIITKTTHC